MWKNIFAWILVISWLMVIFFFSSQNSEESSVQSKGVLSTIIEGTVSLGQKIGFVKEELTDNEKIILIQEFHKPIRKLAHATIYFILSILILVALNTRKEDFIKKALITVIICFVYSLTDEYHQTLVDGRTGEFVDCLIDTFGAILGCTTIKFIKFNRYFEFKTTKN